MIANSRISNIKEFKKLAGIEENEEEHVGEIKYHHLLAHLMCNPPKQECWLGKCTDCPEPGLLAEKLEDIFQDLDIDHITYKQWESTDRTELVTHTNSVSEFVEVIVQKLEILKKHQFINCQQVEYLKQVKNLLLGEVLAFGDFSQNYAFIYQDAAQGVHWNNSSCTLHPWITYYRGQDGEIKTFSLLIISDCLTHETVQVYSFQKLLIEQLKMKLEEEGLILNKIEYGTDGCAKQYKNKKNLSNLAHHVEYFGVKAKWTFQATSHGKGPWNGLAGCVKREAALETLRRPLEGQIQTPIELYNFAKLKFKNIQVEFVSKEDIEKVEKEILVERFKETKTIKGTLGYHSFEPIDNNLTQLIAKQFSYSQEENIVTVSKPTGLGVPQLSTRGRPRGRGARRGQHSSLL